MQKEIRELINRIYAAICRQEEISISFMNGTAGTLIFLDQYGQLCSDTMAGALACSRMDALLEQVNDSSQVLSHTYCDGLAGLLTLFDYMAPRHPQYADLADAELEKHLITLSIEDMQEGEYDFLHGGLGTLNYLSGRLRRTSDPEMSAELRRVLAYFLLLIEQISIARPAGLCWDHPIDGDPAMVNRLCVNMGLAHGTPAIVSALADLHALAIAPARTESLIRKAVSFILSLKSSPTSNQSQFPNHVIAWQDPVYNSRLAWCYGDLGISIALLKAGRALSDAAIINEAEQIAQATILRKTLRDTSLFDAGVCHGTAGVAHLYGIWYRFSGNELYRHAQEYWIAKTLLLSDPEGPMAGFRTFHAPNEWGTDIGLLKGISGIGLVLLSYLYESYDWEYFLGLETYKFAAIN